MGIEPHRPSQDRFKALIAVGSNIDPELNIPKALILLAECVKVTGTSTFYRTEPIGPVPQPAFVNGAWRIETALGPHQVKFDVLRIIEDRLGRVRTQDKYAPRPIDLDLILFEGWVSQDPDLVLPHPDLQRPFVRVPAEELMPQISAALERGPMGHLDLPGEPLPGLTDQLRGLIAGPCSYRSLSCRSWKCHSTQDL